MKTKYEVKSHQVRVISIAISVSFLTAALLPAFTSAAGPVITRGTTSTYAILAGSTITNTGTTSLSGTAGSDIGLSPGTSFTGSGGVSTLGATHLTDTAAATAQLDLTIVYNAALAETVTSTIPTDLVGSTILPGVYNSAAGTFSNSGNVTIDAGGNANAVFIFKTASTLITSDNSTMTLAGGAQACNIYWQVGSSATLGISSQLKGSIYADISITANTSAQISGQLLARSGAITLDSNVITNDSCVAPVPTPTPTPVAPTPAPIPDLPQDSSITGISSSTCTTTEDYIAYLSGSFPSKISNIAVNGTNVASYFWVQSETQVALTLPASASKNITIEVYNGRVPILKQQNFICSVPVIEVVVATPTPTPTATPTPTPTPTPVEEIVTAETVTATEEGGRLPDTGSNSFNYLLIGGGLLVLGSSGFLLRRRLAK